MDFYCHKKSSQSKMKRQRRLTPSTRAKRVKLEIATAPTVDRGRSNESDGEDGVNAVTATATAQEALTDAVPAMTSSDVVVEEAETDQVESIAVNTNTSTHNIVFKTISHEVTTTTTTSILQATDAQTTCIDLTAADPSNHSSSSSVSTPLNTMKVPLSPADYLKSMRWQHLDKSLWVLDSAAHSQAFARTKIAAFDMDGTLIRTKSGHQFPKDHADWLWWNPIIPSHLRQLFAEGYKIVIFTNQKGISSKTQQASHIHRKIEDIIKEVSVPIQAFIATMDDHYRKPHIGMWHRLVTHHNQNLPADLINSIYVGDAAGRQKGWNGSKETPRDHSVADRGFATNIGVPFFTPEEYFLKHKPAPFSWGQFVPYKPITSFFDSSKAIPNQSTSLSSSSTSTILQSSSAVSPIQQHSITQPHSHQSVAQPVSTAKFVSSKQEIVLLVGFPASGKSYFATNEFVAHGYKHINRDSLGTKERCIAAARAALSKNISVVIDNTNPDRDSRAAYVRLAQEFNIPIRCFHLITDRSTSLRLNADRAIQGDRNHVPTIAYNIYAKKLQVPTIGEGFKEVIELRFPYQNT